MIRRVSEQFGKTKILGTLGPATATPEKLKELILLVRNLLPL